VWQQMMREHPAHGTKAWCVQYIYTLGESTATTRGAFVALLAGMDRVLQCRSQIKTCQLATTQVSVTASVCLSPQTPLCAAQYCNRAERGAPEKKAKEKFIHMMYYVPSPDDVLINRLVASATAKTEIVDTGEDKAVSSRVTSTTTTLTTTRQWGFPLFRTARCTSGSSRGGTNTWLYAPISTLYSMTSSTRRARYLPCKIDNSTGSPYAAVLLPVDVLRRRTRMQHGTYCSKIITEVLQECKIGGPLLATAVACQSTPNMLYMFLGGHKSTPVVRRPPENHVSGA